MLGANLGLLVYGEVSVMPLKSNLIENKGAYRLLVSNIIVLNKNTMENDTKIGV